MRSGAWAGRLLSAVAVAVTLTLGSGGCRTSTDDIHRWADTVQGPRKLVAVLTHSKYATDLRVEAAMTLIQMKPRRGKQVGIQGDDENTGLTTALGQLTAKERARIVAEMVPRLVAEMKKPPPKAQAGQPPPPDPSFPYKDAAFALLTDSDGALVTEEKHRAALKSALADWTMVDFARRADESSQMYGTEQILAFLKADGVRKLPELIKPDAPKIDLMAKLVSELGDRQTKLAASKRLVVIATDVNSENWVKRKSVDVDRANKASKLNPTKRQFEAQLAQYQEEELLRVVSSMKRVGQAPIVDWLLKFTADTQQTEKRRAAALAALEGHIDKNSKSQVDAILKLARANDTPDEVRDQALRRVGEMPRKLVVNDLYGLFDHDNWKIRWMAAELVLNMSDASHLDEFMNKLRVAKHMALTEAWRYGTLIGNLKGKPEPLVEKYAAPGNPIQARISALGYYFENGTKEQVSKVARYENDSTRVPECGEDAAGCEWKCTVGEGKQAEVKEITTIGEMVKYCIAPALEKRKKGDKKQNKKK